ncbi:hypothetical protein I204_02726 [Kwoniella mangroviensis CBS 8886]|nr:hypothetical protein I204_02726 [Kwoniella mangroviensis CBS 8886]
MSQYSRNPSTTTAASSPPGSVREITAGPNMAPSYEASQQEAATAAASNQPRNSFYGTPGRAITGLTSTATAAAEADQSSNDDASSEHIAEDLYSTYADATRLSDAHYEVRRRDATQQRRAHQSRTGGSTPLNNPPRL